MTNALTIKHDCDCAHDGDDPVGDNTHRLGKAASDAIDGVVGRRPVAGLGLVASRRLGWNEREQRNANRCNRPDKIESLERQPEVLDEEPHRVGRKGSLREDARGSHRVRRGDVDRLGNRERKGEVLADHDPEDGEERGNDMKRAAVSPTPATGYPDCHPDEQTDANRGRLQGAVRPPDEQGPDDTGADCDTECDKNGEAQPRGLRRVLRRRSGPRARRSSVGRMGSPAERPAEEGGREPGSLLRPPVWRATHRRPRAGGSSPRRSPSAPGSALLAPPGFDPSVVTGKQNRQGRHAPRRLPDACSADTRSHPRARPRSSRSPPIPRQARPEAGAR